jgi:hypothetical protein
LHAITAQDIHRGASAQVTVLEDSPTSISIQVSCGTFLLYCSSGLAGGQPLQLPAGIASVPPSGPFHVYNMRMARVNITVPDELLDAARAAGLNISRVASLGLADEIDRQAKIRELDAYLADLDAYLGPVPQHEIRAAQEWADAVLPAGRGPAAASA